MSCVKGKKSLRQNQQLGWKKECRQLTSFSTQKCASPLTSVSREHCASPNSISLLIACHATDLFHRQLAAVRSLNNAICQGVCGERSCPRSATASHSVAVDRTLSLNLPWTVKVPKNATFKWMHFPSKFFYAFWFCILSYFKLFATSTYVFRCILHSDACAITQSFSNCPVRMYPVMRPSGDHAV